MTSMPVGSFKLCESLDYIFSDAMMKRSRIALRVKASWGDPPREDATYAPKHVCYWFLRYYQTRILLNDDIRTEIKHRTTEFCEIADIFAETMPEEGQDNGQ